VLKPGGVFHFEDVLEGILASLTANRMHDYPEMGCFSGAKFRAALESAGLRVARWQQWGEFMVWGRAVKDITGSLHGMPA
jgi:hypothetical protein